MPSKAGLDPLLDILAAEVGRFHKEDSDALGEGVPELFVLLFQPPEPGRCVVGCRLEFFQDSLDGRYVGPVVGVEDLEEEVLGEIGLVNLTRPALSRNCGAGGRIRPGPPLRPS